MIGPQWPSTPEEFEKLAFDLEWEILSVKQEQLYAKREFLFFCRSLPVGMDVQPQEAQFDLKEVAFKLKIELLSARKENALLKRAEVWNQEYIEVLEHAIEQNQKE